MTELEIGSRNQYKMRNIKWVGGEGEKGAGALRIEEKNNRNMLEK